MKKLLLLNSLLLVGSLSYSMDKERVKKMAEQDQEMDRMIAEVRAMKAGMEDMSRKLGVSVDQSGQEKKGEAAAKKPTGKLASLNASAQNFAHKARTLKSSKQEKAQRQEGKPSQKERCSMSDNYPLDVLIMNPSKESYEKKIKPSQKALEKTKRLNTKDNKEYIDTLLMLEATKNIMQRDLNNVSWLQCLWNYRAYKNYQKSIQMLDKEIALFKDQDKVASLEKTVNTSESKETVVDTLTGQIKIDSEVTGSYLKPQLTHRDVFTRSHMPRTMFEQVKTARE